MTLVLATTWQPRGELPRLERLQDHLRLYDQAVIILPLESARHDVFQLNQIPGVKARMVRGDWSAGRHEALREAVDAGADFIHYADLDRWVRWAETRPDELEQTVAALSTADCLLINRTQAAHETHPQALFKSETLTNLAFSHLLGRPIDISPGSRGFSRKAAEFLLEHSPPGRVMGVDAEWPILLQQAGFTFAAVAVDGLDWESADQYQPQAADANRQREVAAAYDADAQHWNYRLDVALEIMQSGLDALIRTTENTEKHRD
jgi:hypothetical protein